MKMKKRESDSVWRFHLRLIFAISVALAKGSLTSDRLKLKQSNKEKFTKKEELTLSKRMEAAKDVPVPVTPRINTSPHSQWYTRKTRKKVKLDSESISDAGGTAYVSKTFFVTPSTKKSKPEEATK